MNHENTSPPQEEEKSFLRVIVHSFFIIPFLIAVFGVLLFAGMRLLTQEKRSVYDYLNDVKVGGRSKRWQGAFELSKMLSNPKLVPQEQRFDNELVAAYAAAKHDDNRVRQYLALAMGRTKKKVFGPVLTQSLEGAKDENLAAIIYAIGMIGDPANAAHLHDYTGHADPRVRSWAVAALGHLGNPESVQFLKKGLQDPEPNVQWGSAISLTNMGDLSGKTILLNVLNRDYLNQFSEVDPTEQNNLIMTAIGAGSSVRDREIRARIEDLAQNDSNMAVRAAAMKALKKVK